MSFQALIFDLDGTVVQSQRDALPSLKVVEAVDEAKKYLKVACATGRSAKAAQSVIQSLKLVSPCIVAGGAQIIDPISFSVIWEVLLSQEKIQEIITKIWQFNYFVRGSNDEKQKTLVQMYENTQSHPSFYIIGLNQTELIELGKVLETISDINFYSSTSWEANKWSVQITHSDASKKKALEKWLEIEKVSSHHVIAIGDANNDKPLFEAAGFKIAMGNASQELISLADWVAPSVDNDGVAAAIHKCVLNVNPT